MVSQADDGAQRVALLVVYGVVVLATTLVTGLGIHRTWMATPTSSHTVTTIPTIPTTASTPLPVMEIKIPATSASSAAQVDEMQAKAQAAADDASIEVTQNVVKFYFASGKADLAAGARDAMAELIQSAQTGRKLAITGFHDASGSASHNAGLAKKRALVVRAALMAAGVASSQIQLKKPEPVNANNTNTNTNTNDAQARRVEISLL